jgi:hypothetical protein
MDISRRALIAALLISVAVFPAQAQRAATGGDIPKVEAVAARPGMVVAQE